jgi:hypothetical protein
MKHFSKLTLALTSLLPRVALAANDAQCSGAQAIGAPDCTGGSLTSTIDTAINAIFYVAGAVAVLIIIIGGIGYIASTGDPGRITKAKNTILYAVIGLVVVILARAIVAFVVGRV